MLGLSDRLCFSGRWQEEGLLRHVLGALAVTTYEAPRKRIRSKWIQTLLA